LDNFRHAVERICGGCGAEVEPHAACHKCGTLNDNPVAI
jgi:ribosomal protein L40E